MQKTLEREISRLSKLLKISADLGGIFANERTEKIESGIVEMLCDSFGATSATLFFTSVGKEISRISTGAERPGEYAKEQLKEISRHFPDASRSCRFGPLSLCRSDHAPAYWLAARSDASGRGEDCILLGRDGEAWEEEDEQTLLSFAAMMTPSLEVRRAGGRETQERRQAEISLARSENRLRSFFEEARDMVYTADADDIVTSLNRAGVLLAGRSGKGEVVGRKFSTLVLNPEDRDDFLRRLREDGFIDDFEFVMRRGDGTAVFCLENAHALRDANGGIVEVQGIVRDISDRIQNERELWRTNLELAETNLKLQQSQIMMVQSEKLASIGQLAAGIAHEINNPLGFLKSNHTMLGKYFDSMKNLFRTLPSPVAGGVETDERNERVARLIEKVEEVLAESTEGYDRIMAIVSNLKSFSRIEGSGEAEPYDLNNGIASTLTVAWNEIKYVADVRREFGELPILKARGGGINQVILNILVNSAQAIKGQNRPTKGQIIIRTKAAPGRVILEIEDDGPGIPEDVKGRIFDPFFTTKGPGKGTGLGLSISYDIIVDKHHGSLAVTDAPAGGTVFTITLPTEDPALPS
jgi:PAS domain S-box-containing protein